MEKAADVLAQSKKPQATPPASTHAPEEVYPDRMMVKLWERMTQLYGSLWRERFGPATDRNGKLTETAETWRAALYNQKIQPAEVKVGLETCLTREIAFAPSLPEFLSLCKRGRPATVSHKMFPKLLPQPRDKALAATSLSAIRDVLKHGRATGSDDAPKPPEDSEAGSSNTSATETGA